MKNSERYSLAHPVEGGYQWWAVNDMEKMYAVVSVSASVPHAEEIARFAYAKITGEAAEEETIMTTVTSKLEIGQSSGIGVQRDYQFPVIEVDTHKIVALCKLRSQAEAVVNGDIVLEAATKEI